VAGGGPAALYTPWAAGFEKQYPGITVQVRGAFSNQLVAGTGSAAAQRRPGCRRRDPADAAGLRAVEGGRARCSRPTSRPRNTWRRTGATTTGATCRPACTGWATATTRARSPPGRSPGRPPGSPARGAAAASSPPTRTKTTSRCTCTACWPNGTAGRSPASCWPAARSSSMATSAWPRAWPPERQRCRPATSSASRRRSPGGPPGVHDPGRRSDAGMAAERRDP
jgi:hypothetical protein